MVTEFDGNEIAIIGMAGRFPKAGNLDEFWHNLRDGRECVDFYDEAELLAAGLDPRRLAHPAYVKAAAAMDGVELFDAAFFGYSPREAEIIDPQHRLLLECAWQALEDSGYDADTYAGAVGVFAGATINTYLLLNLAPNADLLSSFDDLQLNLANSGDFLTTRISYKLNLKGPSHLVQSACSTSLVAVHLACQSLLNEESDMALAGGVSNNEKLRRGYRYVEGGMMSPDGHCRAFDAGAQGTIFGSGVGMVVLKRLEDALADRDHIRAIIKGSAINNDGAFKVGYAAPSVEGQAAVIAEALANAGVSPDTVTYIEAHGTGTPLGDPVEVQALTKAFRSGTSRKSYCALGTVKTNIGHLDAAAGVAGLIKTVLALEHKVLPPSLNFKQPNPQIDFGNSPFFVNSQLREWTGDAGPRRAGISAFGVGGTNAHVIVEEAPPAEPSGPSRSHQLLVLSAKDETALAAASRNLAAYLQSHPEANLADVAYTLQVGRKAFATRMAVACRDVQEAVSALAHPTDAEAFSTVDSAGNRPVTFMFPGQGAQSVNMAAGLYGEEKSFREEVDRCSQKLKPRLGLDLREVLYPPADKQEWAARQLDQTEITQPALFVIEYALARTWISWGLRPSAMIGHSIGEYVAACLAGVMSLDDALHLVAARGRFMQAQPPGAMLAVSLPEDEARVLLGEGLSLAAINGPSQCVISGEAERIERLAERLAAAGIVCKRLRTSHAFHSEMMEPAADALREEAKRIELRPPLIPFISNVTGTWITDAEATSADYWARHLRQAVRFADGIQEITKNPACVLLEVGPQQTLTAMVKRQLARSSERVVLASLPAQSQEASDVQMLTTTLGRLWMAGMPVDWLAFHSLALRRRLPLPAYPFQPQRFWIAPPTSSPALPAIAPPAAAKLSDLASWFYLPSFKRSLPAPTTKLSALAQQARCWLLLMDDSGLGQRLADLLARLDQQVVTVGVADRFARLGPASYAIRVGQPEDYRQLMRGLEQEGLQADMIVHLWSLGSEAAAGSAEPFARQQERGLFSLLFLAQALEETGMTQPLQLEVITDQLYAITYDESISPEKATMIGACKVIAQECSNISCHCIDVRFDPSRSEHLESLAEQLLARTVSTSSEAVVAYRGAQPWSRIHEAVELDAPTDSNPLRENGVYFFTGGLEGIGYEIAKYLARELKAKLAFVGAAPLPAREEWESWLASRDETETTSAAIRRLKTLEDFGAETLALRADPADENQLRQAIAQAEKRFGNLNGVIHAAGVFGTKSFRALAETGREEVAWHFQTKVFPAYALEKALAGKALDFCLLDSSLSSILGGLGYLAYASANCFLDSFVEAHNQRGGVPWISINWDAWRFGEGTAQLTVISKELAELAMTPEEGAEVFRRILASGMTGQVIVSTGPLQERMKHRARAEAAPRVGGSAGETAASPLHPRPHLKNAYVAPASQLEQTIATVWQHALGIEPVGALDNFFDLGGDSLLAVQVIAQLKKALEVEIPVVSLYEGVTIKSLAELLNREADPGPEAPRAEREQRTARRKQFQEKQRTRRKQTA